MKTTIETLNNLSQKIDLNLFFVVRVWGKEITLQGNKSSLKRVNEIFKTPKKLSENGWFESQHEFEGCIIKIVLT